MQSFQDYTLFLTQDRSKDGYYSIAGGSTHVFAFQIVKNSVTVIQAVHTAEQVQDFSVKMWFSTAPLDGILFGQYDFLNTLVLLKYAARSITIWDVNAPLLPKTNLSLDSDTTYYINIQNQQAAANAYRLIIPT